MKSYNPRSLDEFITLQASLPAQTQILSGGTDWIIAHRRKAEDLPALLWIGGIPDLKRIAIDDQGQLHIGACCTMAALEQSDLLRGAFRVIAEAAASVGSTQIRNRATIGGNIANASPAADLAAPLIALNASAHILREGAVFDLPVSELITGAEKTVLRPLDILLGFTLPAFPKEAESHYYKLGSREQLSISRFGVAMVLWRTQGLVEQANIAIGAIGAKAVRMPELERALIGRRVDTSSADALGDLLADYIRNTSRRQYKAWASCGVMEDALALFTQDN